MKKKKPAIRYRESSDLSVSSSTLAWTVSLAVVGLLGWSLFGQKAADATA